MWKMAVIWEMEDKVQPWKSRDTNTLREKRSLGSKNNTVQYEAPNQENNIQYGNSISAGNIRSEISRDK